MPTVHPLTVVIAVKDGSAYLREALQSLIGQTHQEWQAIIVDDYSSEDLASLVSEFNEPRFTYVRNDGIAGKSAARNLGNRLVKSEWIAVSDGDDINLPRRLEVAWKAIQEHPEAAVFYSRLYEFEDGSYVMKASKHGVEVDRSHLYSKGGIPHATLTYRKSDWEASGGYDETLDSSEDYNLILSFADRHLGFHFIGEPLYLYRRYPTQTTREPESRARMYRNADMVRERHVKYK